ncbi:FabD/lysophospholipase-like protein, partial [Viridothelium virens]
MAARADERNPNAPLRLLSLDGGGVRGLSSLMVLDDLMENIAQEEKRLGLRRRNDNTRLKPCDYFDLIGGTSTGGIIAILLGRLRLNCRQCIDIYSELAEEIFKNDRVMKIFGTKIPLSSNRFSGVVLEKAIKKALVKLGYKEDELMWDATLFEQVDEPEAEMPDDSIWANFKQPNVSEDAVPSLTESPIQVRSRNTTESRDDPKNKSALIRRDTQSSRRSVKISQKAPERKPTFRLHRTGSVHQKPGQRGCRAFVVSTLKNALGAPRIFSTYDANDHTTKIWEALRATSAAPTFFEEISFGKPQMTYLDGGVGFNNPCAEVDYAAKSLWEGRPIGCIVSVGTGLQTIPSVKKANTWLPFGLGTDIALAGALASMATGTARVDNEMQRMYYHSGTKYHRFDVDGGIANISMEEFMREDEMGALTEQYMRDPQQVRRARHLGELMVRLSALPPHFEITVNQFRIGVAGRGVIEGAF